MSVGELAPRGDGMETGLELTQPAGDETVAELYAELELGEAPMVAEVKNGAILLYGRERVLDGMSLVLNRAVLESDLDESTLLERLSRKDLVPEFWYADLLSFRDVFESGQAI